MWQDILIPIIVISFSVALIPQIIQNFRTKKRSISIITATITMIGAYTLAFVYLTLELHLSTILQILAGTLWLILLIQSVRYKK